MAAPVAQLAAALGFEKPLAPWADFRTDYMFTRGYNKSPAWDQVDLRAHWSPQGGKYTVIAYVKNVFDTKGYDAAVAGSQRNFNPSVPSDQFLTGAQNLELTPPRLYGVELQYRF